MHLSLHQTRRIPFSPSSVRSSIHLLRHRTLEHALYRSSKVRPPMPLPPHPARRMTRASTHFSAVTYIALEWGRARTRSLSRPLIGITPLPRPKSLHPQRAPAPSHPAQPTFAFPLPSKRLWFALPPHNLQGMLMIGRHLSFGSSFPESRLLMRCTCGNYSSDG